MNKSKQKEEKTKVDDKNTDTENDEEFLSFSKYVDQYSGDIEPEEKEKESEDDSDEKTEEEDDSTSDEDEK